MKHLYALHLLITFTEIDKTRLSSRFIPSFGMSVSLFARGKPEKITAKKASVLIPPRPLSGNLEYDMSIFFWFVELVSNRHKHQISSIN